MLVLSRQRDETIMIGDHIEVTVVDVRGDKVRIGINAPTSVAVHRKEVYDAIKKENEDAARFEQRQLDGIKVSESTPPRRSASASASGRGPTPIRASGLDALKCRTA
jgi:carbon storage regulator